MLDPPDPRNRALSGKLYSISPMLPETKLYSSGLSLSLAQNNLLTAGGKSNVQLQKQNAIRLETFVYLWLLLPAYFSLRERLVPCKPTVSGAPGLSEGFWRCAPTHAQIPLFSFRAPPVSEIERGLLQLPKAFSKGFLCCGR